MCTQNQNPGRGLNYPFSPFCLSKKKIQEFLTQSKNNCYLVENYDYFVFCYSTLYPRLRWFSLHSFSKYLLSDWYEALDQVLTLLSPYCHRAFGVEEKYRHGSWHLQYCVVEEDTGASGTIEEGYISSHFQPPSHPSQRWSQR